MYEYMLAYHKPLVMKHDRGMERAADTASNIGWIFVNESMAAKNDTVKVRRGKGEPP
jgi:hypothetical protein